MKKRFYLFFGAIALLSPTVLSSCGGTSTANVDADFVEVPMHYARLFRVFKADGVTRVDVVNPWDTTSLMKRYYLVPVGAKPISKADGIVVTVPLKSMACAAATEISCAERLGLLDSIVGVSEKQYINNQHILGRMDKGTVADIGPSMSLNVESLIKISPDILFVSPFKDNKYGAVEASGIQLGVVSAYLETHPLGRAEWIKFMALFFGKEKEAESYFNELEVRYQKLAEKAKAAAFRPSVLSGKPYQGIWYVSPGNSYMAQLFADAGASYVFADRISQGPIPLDFETVYKKAYNADYWVILENYPGDYTYKALLDEYAPYGDFAAYKARKVVFCNTYRSTYYDEGFLKPDVLLADLLNAFHPELKEGSVPVYFSMLKSE